MISCLVAATSKGRHCVWFSAWPAKVTAGDSGFITGCFPRDSTLEPYMDGTINFEWLFRSARLALFSSHCQ